MKFDKVSWCLLSRMNSLATRPKALIRLFDGQTTEWCWAMWKFYPTSVEMHDKAFTCALLLFSFWHSLSRYIPDFHRLDQFPSVVCSQRMEIHFKCVREWERLVNFAMMCAYLLCVCDNYQWMNFNVLSVKYRFPYRFSLSNKPYDKDSAIQIFAHFFSVRSK